MGIIVLGIGIPLFVLLGACVAMGDFLSASVIIAAYCTFLGLWKWKQSLPEKVWSKSRFKYGRYVRIGIGTALFAIAMVQLGVVARTFWANYFGEESHSADLSDIYFGAILAVCGIAVVGYERVAGILFMALFFSTMLTGAFLRLLADRFGQVSGMEWAEVFALAFLIVFALGQRFHWSKGFALTGMLFMIAAELGAYLTM